MLSVNSAIASFPFCALMSFPIFSKNGSPAITDANLVLGRLLPDYFPKIFGETEDAPLDVDASRTALEALTKEINAETGGSMSVDEVAWG
jgi:5-oxoprolinase (ATP-hydrolysing)